MNTSHMAQTHHNISHMHERTLWWAMSLTGGFMFVEFIAGWWSGSLALMADSLHMLTDAAALALALFAVRWARRHADDHRTFGYGRVQVLAAFVNAAAVMGLSAVLATQAVRRIWRDDINIDSGVMFWVAVAGLFVNLVIFLILHRNQRDSLNIKAAALHVLGDLLSSAAVVVSALLIQWTGIWQIDLAATFIVATFIANSARYVIRESAHILLEGRPRNLSLSAVAAAVTEKVPEVAGVHNLHAWSLSGEDVLLTMHATLKEDSTRSDDDVLRSIKELLQQDFRIQHSTIQVERSFCDRDMPDLPAAAQEAAGDGHSHGPGCAHHH